MNNRLYTIQETANILGVSTKTLRRWDQGGRFVPTRTAGNQRRYTQDQINEFKKTPKSASKPASKAKVIEPLFQESAPKAPEAAHSLPSVLSALPSNSFLRQHFILRHQEQANDESKNIVLRKEEESKQPLNRGYMSKFNPVKMGFMFAALLIMLSFAGAVVMTRYNVVSGLAQKKDQFVKFIANLPQISISIKPNDLSFAPQNNQAVLAAAVGKSNLALNVNVPSFFSESVGIGTTTANPSAILDLTSQDKGFLAPRMTTAQRDAISSPASGLFVYNTVTKQYNMYDGTSWKAVGGLTAVGDVTTGDAFTQTGANGNSLYFHGTGGGVGQITGGSLSGNQTYTLPGASGTFITTGNLTDITKVGTIGTGTWNGTTIAVGNGGTGATSLTGILLGNGTSAMTGLTTSAGISEVISDETGAGSLVFNTDPVFAGNIVPSIAGVSNLGSSALPWNNVYANNFIGASTGASGYWQRNSNAISPITLSDDILVGSNSTNSALIRLSGTNVVGSNSSWFNAGNVGIGTTNPLAALSVGSTSQFQVNSAGAIVATTGITSSGLLSFTGTDHAGIKLNNLTTAQRDALTPAAGMSIFNTSVSKMQVYNGSSWKNVGNPEVGAEVAGGTPGSVLFVDASGNLGQDNDNFFWSEADARLGLGTTAPLATLDVAGSASVSGSISLNGEGTAHAFNIMDSGVLNFQRSVGGDTGLTSTMFLANSGYVGIGTTAPIAQLNVNVNTDTVAHSLALTNSSSFNGMWGQAIDFYNRGGGIGGGIRYVNTGGPMVGTMLELGNYYGNPNSFTSELTIISGGNVGVGNTYPLSLFSVGSSSQFQVNSAGAIAAATGITSSGTITFSGLSTGIAHLNSSGVMSSSAVNLATDVTGILGTANGGSFWNSSLGALYPGNTTRDILLGGTSTASAKFGFLNMAGGNPTATISSNLSLIVPTGNAPAATFNLLNNGTLNFQRSAGGDAGLTSTLYLANNGNVGIGTTVPGDSLEVQKDGNVYANIHATTGTGQVAGIKLQRGSWLTDGSRDYSIYDSGGSFYIDASYLNSTQNILTSDGYSNLTTSLYFGIGTTTPLAALDVRGANNFMPVASISGSTSFAAMAIDNRGTGDLFTASKSGATKFVISNSGNVGIGIGTPANKLDILNGDARLITDTDVMSRVLFTRNNLDVGEIGTRNSALTIKAWNNKDIFLTDYQDRGIVVKNGGNVGIGTTSPAGLLHLSGIAGGNATLIANTGNAVNDLFTASSSGTPKFTIANNGNINFAGSTSFMTTLTSAATAARTITFPDATGTLCLQGSAACGFAMGTNYWASTNGALYPSNSTMDILFGATATSSAKFGFLNMAAGNPTATISSNLSLAVPTGNTYAATFNLLNNGTLNFQRSVGGDAGLTSTLFLNNNGYIGIGTTNPLARLDVRGLSGSIPAASISASTSFASLLVDNSGIGDLFTASKSGATKFVINNAGNVGIGVKSPQSTLSVNGTFRLGANVAAPVTGSELAIFDDQNGAKSDWSFVVASDGFPTINLSSSNGTLGSPTLSTSAGAYGTINGFGYKGTAWVRAASIELTKDGAPSATSMPSKINFLTTRVGSLTAATRMVIDNNGYVGIGITTPLATLDVRGASGTIPAASISAQSSFASLLVDNSGIGDLLTASKSGATKFVIANNGNVGIGLTNPSSTLSVNGTFRLGANAAPLLTGTEIAQFDDQDGRKSDWSFVVAGGGNPAINLAASNGTLTSPTESAGDLGLIRAAGYDGSHWQSAASMGFSTDGTVSTGIVPSQIFFNTTSVAGVNDTRMVINNAGNVGIGIYKPTSMLTVAGWANAGRFDAAQFNGITIATGSGTLTLNNNTINIGGNITTANAFTTTGNYALTLNTTGTTSVTLPTTGTLVNDQVSSLTNLGTVSTSLTGMLKASSGVLSAAAAGTDYIAGGVGANHQLAYFTASGALTGSNGLWFDGAKLGIGTTSPLAGLDVRGVNDFMPAASISATTSFAGMVVDNSGTGNLFTASKSGATKFVIRNNGSVSINGMPTGSGALGILQTADTNSGGIVVYNSASAASIRWWIDSNNVQRLDNMTDASGKIAINGAGNGSVGIGTTAPTGVLHVSGIAGGNATAIFDTRNSTNDLLTASSSGTPKFAINNNGNIQFAGSTSFMTTLTSAATAARTITFPDASGTICLSSANCSFDAFWNSASGALYPGNTTMDLLVGGSSTASAIIKLAGINAGSNNLLDIFNSGSSVFSVSANQVNANIPVSFNAPGDVSMAYDLQFTNPTASYIKSAAPLYIQSGDSNSNYDLTLAGSGVGNVVINSTLIAQNTANSTTAYQFLNASGSALLNIDTLNGQVGVLGQAGYSPLNIASSSGTSLFNIAANGYVGIGTTNPLGNLSVYSAADVNATAGDFVVNASGTYPSVVVGRLSGTNNSSDSFIVRDRANNNVLVVNSGNVASGYSSYFSGNVGIGTTAPAAALQIKADGPNGNLSNAGLEITSLFQQPLISTNSASARVLMNNGYPSGSSGVSLFAPTGTGSFLLGAYDPGSGAFDGISQPSTYHTRFGGLYSNWASTNAPAAGSVYIETDTGNDYMSFFTTGTTPDMRLDNGKFGIGTTSPASILHVSGVLGGKATAIFDTRNSANDLLTASSSGTPKFAINNNGNIQFAGSTNFLTTLTSAATAARTITFPDASGTLCLSSGNCSFDAFWNTGSGALYAGNTTMDLLLGGTSTASAKFGFLNMAGGNPTATISSNLSLVVPTGNAYAATFNLLNNGTLNFQRSAGGDAGLTSTLFLNNNGYIGIGTTAPGSLLTLANDGWISGISTSSGVTNMFKLNTADQIQVGAALSIDGGVTFPSDGGYVTAMDMPFTTTGTNAYVFRMGTSNVMSVYGQSDVSGNASNLSVGIGTTTPLATLDVRGLTGTIPAASVSAQSSFASLLVDNSGTGDLFTASKSGATKFVITNAGNVGINGVTRPLVALDVTGSASMSGNIGLNGASTAHTFNILDNGTLNFQRSAGGDAGLASALFLNSNGYVGIGTTAPGYKLEVAGDISINGGTKIDWAHGSAKIELLTYDLAFSNWTGSALTEKMRITSGGNVGIGTTNPLAALDVRGISGTTPAASISAQSSFASMIVDNSGIGDLFTASKSGGPKFVINNAGNVGIGTANPVSLLDVNRKLNVLSSGFVGIGNTSPQWTADIIIPGATSGTGLNIHTNVAGDATGYLRFTNTTNNDATGTYSSFIGGDRNSILGTSLVFGTAAVVANNPTEKMRLTGAGLLGIGVTSPLATLDIRGENNFMPAASVSALTTFAAMVVDNRGTGDIFTASKSGSTKFVIANGGNVGIGMTAPLLKLDVQDSQSASAAAQIYNTNTGTNADGLIIKLGNTSTSAVNSGNHFLSFETAGIGVVGSVQGNGATGVTYATNGIADFAEYFKKDQNQSIPFGSVVCLDSNGLAVTCDSNSSRIIGVASEQPAFLGGENLGDRSISVGLVGQVRTRVSAVNGEIKIGDPLTASSINGVAVKATAAGQILGKALEPFDSAQGGEGTILVSVNISWYNPSVYIASDGTLANVASTVASLSDKLASQGDALQAQIASVSAQTNYVLANDPLFKAAQDKASDLQSKLDILSQKVEEQASASAFLTEIVQSQVLGASTSVVMDLGDVEIHSATISSNLMVLGRTTVGDLGVTGNINAGVLAIHGIDGEISTLGGDLYLQKNGLGGVNIADGKVIIDATGNVSVAGTVTADTVESNSYTVLGDQSIGSASISAGLTFIDVVTPAASVDSKIFLTPTSLTDRQLTVVSKSNGKFRVAIPIKATTPTTFDWWIVGNK